MRHEARGAGPSGTPLSAVIFDVDGVLVQSMERHFESYQKAYDTLGVRVTREDVFDNEGRGSREIIRAISDEHGLGLSAEKLEQLNAIKQQTFAAFGPMPMYPGAEAMIRALHAEGLKLALVTGTVRRNVDAHFPQLVPLFDAIVTADDVKRTKPDPEPYLKAVEKLALPAGACIVVENAPLGIRAAKGAGLRVVGITSTLPPVRLAEADWVVADINAARKAVEALR